MKIEYAQTYKVVISDDTERSILNRRAFKAPGLLHTSNGFRDVYADMHRDYIAMQDTRPIDAIGKPLAPVINPTTPMPVIHTGNLQMLPPMAETEYIEAVHVPEQDEDAHVEGPLSLQQKIKIIAVIIFMLIFCAGLLTLGLLCNGFMPAP